MKRLLYISAILLLVFIGSFSFSQEVVSIYDPILLQGNEYTITGLLYFINGEFVLCPRNAYDVDGIVSIQKGKQ